MTEMSDCHRSAAELRLSLSLVLTLQFQCEAVGAGVIRLEITIPPGHSSHTRTGRLKIYIKERRASRRSRRGEERRSRRYTGRQQTQGWRKSGSITNNF